MKIYDYNGKKNICGDRLREARVIQRLRQEDLARFVSDFELKVFAKVLGVSVDWLLGNE